MSTPGSTQKQFTQALDDLVGQLKHDRTVLAVILCGSLSYDTVWAKSDIDLTIVTVDEKSADTPGVSLSSHGVNVHAFLIARAEFRKIVEGAARNSFMHSLLARGRLLYSQDDTLTNLCARLHEIGERDTRLQLLQAAAQAILPINKAHKWFVTRGDLDYTALWILYAATHLARVEVLTARMLADREVIPQAMNLNPVFFRQIYSDLLNSRKTRRNVQAALNAIDRYLAERSPVLFGPVIDYLREAGEARSCSEIEAHFKRNFDVENMTSACEYLAGEGLITRAAVPLRLTKKSTAQMQELAFVFTEEARDEF